MIALERDHRVNVRLPGWLYAQIKELADSWGGDVSKQIRYELMANRGKVKGPSLPSAPDHEGAPRKRKSS